MMTYDPKTVILVRYTNYRGETSVRRIVPLRIRFAATEWHPTEQWLMDAYDLDRQAERSFALSDVVEWHVSDSGTGAVSRAC
jgi:predicted DNA-binding transcriptional regulator YafY